MGIEVQAPERYEASLRKLFPRGVYWDRQFADAESDCSLFCRAKLDALIRFRNRMSDLQDESMIQSARETLDDWERVLTGSVSAGLTAEQRRGLLIAAKSGSVTIPVIKEIGQMYGITVTNTAFPFRPAFFGFSRFGIDRIAGPASFSTLFIYAADSENGEAKAAFEKILRLRALANYILYFFYGGI
ncbi:MAG: hypothetical protein LBK08_04005 [Treponema sp.]|jgi:uncharacterized protein YmfQ (DUF2313 family)|nr:hypothetical protein [Treponema sp.]